MNGSVLVQNVNVVLDHRFLYHRFLLVVHHLVVDGRLLLLPLRQRRLRGRHEGERRLLNLGLHPPRQIDLVGPAGGGGRHLGVDLILFLRRGSGGGSGSGGRGGRGGGGVDCRHLRRRGRFSTGSVEGVN